MPVKKDQPIVDTETGEILPPGTMIPTRDTGDRVIEANPEAVRDRLKARFRSAESVDELFDALSGQTSDAMIGRRFEFLGVEWQPYESDSGVIPLATCDVVDLDTGKPTEFVTTATMLVEFLRRVELLGAFPFKARIAGKKTRNNQTALNFERV
jgi:hypothetical protein